MYESVPDFYNGKSIFLTGSTGFLGKALLEKLLYSCTEIDKIYILVREKRNVEPEKRLQIIFDQPVFSRIRRERPEALSKVVLVNGDLLKKNFGISHEDLNNLINKVGVVFHVAACVRFNMTLEEAVNINVGGTEKILELSRKMKYLKVFVYVSTSYSNVDRAEIEEVVYPPPCRLEDIKKFILLGTTDKEIEDVIGSRPNTYTLTKALAETVIAQNSKDIPSIIVRPSIVCASVAEPFVSWLDTAQGISQLIAATGRGINRVLLCDYNNVMDLVPIDYVVNVIIVAAAKGVRPGGVEVYNSSTSAVNPVTYGKVLEYAIADAKKNNWNLLPISSVRYTKSKAVMNILTFFLQSVPIHVEDFIQSLKGSPTKYSEILDKLLTVRKVLECFTSFNWKIHASKTCDLFTSLSHPDKNIFPCDLREIDWDEYLPIYYAGITNCLKLRKPDSSPDK